MNESTPRKRLCPLFGMPNGYRSEPCKQHTCQLWVYVYTTEAVQVEMCAFEAMARKNANGQIAV